MGTLAIEKDRLKENPVYQRINGFSGAVRSLDNLSLEKGDVFTFPDTYEVYEQKIGNSTAQLILVELENGQSKHFYPSTFTKSRRIYDEDGTPTNQRVYTGGTAAEEFRKHTSVNEAMNALKGRKVIVSDIQSVRTVRYGTQELTNALIPTIDFVVE